MQIGDGSNTNILEDKWLRGDPIKTKQGINLEELGLRRVKDLMNDLHQVWNICLIRNVFDPDTSFRILSTYIPTESFQDRFAWSESKVGSLKVKDVYALYLRQRGTLGPNKNNRSFWSKLWASDLKPKWKFFVWRLLHRALSLNYNLRKRDVPVQEPYYMCTQHKEDENHLFRDCFITSRVWSSSYLGIKTASSQPITLNEWIQNFLKFFWKEDGIKFERTREFVATLWAICIHRNNIAFRNLHEDPITILRRKDTLIRECEESKKIKEAYLKVSPSGPRHPNRSLALNV